MAIERVQRSDRPARHDLIVEPLDNVLDPVNFTPRLLTLLTNALVWRESHQLRRQFGLGTNDWRVISALAMRPGLSATEVCDFIGVNKAIVSKSVNGLVERDLIALGGGPRGSRSMYLTSEGAVIHDQMLPISAQGQEIVLSELTPEEIDRLNTLLRRMLKKTRELESLEGEPPVAGHRGAVAEL